MKTYNQLEKKFDEQVNELQNKCNHKQLYPWAEKQWALGHGTGISVRVCRTCNKEVMTFYRANICDKCGEEFNWFYQKCFKCNSKKFKTYEITKKDDKIISKVKVK